MSRLTRDGTAEPLSRDQILRHARRQGKIIFPVQLTTSRIGNLTRLIQTLLYVMTIHTAYIHTYSTTLPYCSQILLHFPGTRYYPLPPPPTKKHRRGSPSVHPKRLPVHSRRWPVYLNLSPTMFEGLRGEFRWHLRSDIEVRRVGQVIPGLEIFCGGWKREARQDVGVRVCVLRSVLYRKSVRIQEVDPSLYAIALV